MKQKQKRQQTPRKLQKLKAQSMSNFINSFGFENQIEIILEKKLFNKKLLQNKKKKQNYRNLSNKIIKNSLYL